MKAMILAAGRGSRMREKTASCPKPLLKVQGKALIEHNLERLAKAGIKECMINISYRGEQIRQQLGDGTRFGMALHYSFEPEALESAGGVIHVLDFFEQRPFILLSADLWTDYPFKQLKEKTLNTLAHLVLVNNPDHHPTGDFYLQQKSQLSLDQGQRYTYANIGIYKPTLFSPYCKGKRKLVEVLHQGIKTQAISGEHYGGEWRNIDTPERLAAVNGAPERI
jgi:MurNAc alpha-1-phosphate uridylyltransferase